MTIRPLQLPGWDLRSGWGRDPDRGYFYAQLTHNDRAIDTDRPDVWITSPYGPPVTSLDDLAAAIATEAGAAVDDVRQALVDSARNGMQRSG